MRPEQIVSALSSFPAVARKWFSDVTTLLQGNLIPRENFRLETVSGAAPGTADTELTIDVSTLKLDRAPTYIVTLRSDNGGVVYESSRGSWTSTTIKGKCTKANTNYVVQVI